MEKKKKKDRGKYNFIYCDVYRTVVAIFIGDCESLIRWMNKQFTAPKYKQLRENVMSTCSEENYKENDVAARTYLDNIGHTIIHIPEFSFSYDEVEIASLGHEVLHAAYNVLDFVGVEYRYGGANEPYTYLFEHIMYHALRKKEYKKA